MTQNLPTVAVIGAGLEFNKTAYLGIFPSNQKP
jgi:hypothetical protein